MRGSPIIEADFVVPTLLGDVPDDLGLVPPALEVGDLAVGCLDLGRNVQGLAIGVHIRHLRYIR